MKFKVTSMNINTTTISFCVLLFSCSNTPKIDWEAQRQEILKLDAEAREYHFKKDAKTLVEGFSKDFLSINKGKIDRPTYENSYQRFDAYFNSVKFIKWDNNKEPIVRFSDDGSIAYVAVDKLVILEAKDESNKTVMDTAHFAWLSVFKKEHDKWFLDCIASTNK
jgi:hypothetical protein